MMKHNTLRHTKNLKTPSAKEEALAVLSEMERQAEQRLIDAGQEFQDIAYEMEWRLRDWSRLTDESRKLEQQLLLSGRATPRFNLRARTIRTQPQALRKDKWSKMQALLQDRLDCNHRAREETLAAIMSGNEEGQLLQREIFSLQDKVKRIGRILSKHHRAAQSIINESDAAAALAQLNVVFMQQEDLPDPSTLIAAACVIGEETAYIAREE